MSSLPQTEILLYAAQRFRKHNIIPFDAVHPFAASAESICTTLQDLLSTTEQLTSSLLLYSSTSNALSNPKLISLLRQHSSIAHTLHESERDTSHIIDALQQQSRIPYGEDIPLDLEAIPQWCISRLEKWGATLGMETFKDHVREGGISLVLGGKVIVIDADFNVDTTDPFHPGVSVSNVKTSYAVTNSTSGTPSNGGSAALNSFLRDIIERFHSEVQRPAETRDPQEASKIGSNVLTQLRYLVMLDKLASKPDEGGLKWFGGMDDLCSILESFTNLEAESAASALSVSQVPLDIFLLRAHGLPLPYLLSPSISFLVHLSPVSYLTLLRGFENMEQSKNKSEDTSVNIPRSLLRTYIRSCPRGVTTATLLLSPGSGAHIRPVAMSMPNFSLRPSFSLVPQNSEPEFTFPQLADLSNSMASYVSDANGGQCAWHLDFTNDGKSPGVVMSQSRMREIELLVNPLAGLDAFDLVQMVPFGNGSWVHLLLSLESDPTPERYIASYISPNNIHPSLHLLLTVPEEPGYRLERVCVHNMKEVWGILEVVREQCWLNELLTSCDWTTDKLLDNTPEVTTGIESTEDELQTILAGNITPTKIPVNVYLPVSPIEFFGLDMPISRCRGTRVVMTSPERPPISGLMEITVTYDETRPRGIAVNVSGAMGADIKLDVLEEISRRGGTLGLPGRVWAKTQPSL